MKPTNGVAVTGATCEQSNGKTIMTFTRNAAASGNTENAIATGVGTKTSFIWAYGSSNTLAYHSQRGVIEYDVSSSPSSSTAPSPSSNVAPSPQQESGTLTLNANLKAEVTLSSDKTTVSIVVTYTGSAWVGLGVGTSMTNADIVICSGANQGVERYWSTGQTKPTNGVAVTGATCEQSNGKTIM